jgi:hypothetical protein
VLHTPKLRNDRPEGRKILFEFDEEVLQRRETGMRVERSDQRRRLGGREIEDAQELGPRGGGEGGEPLSQALFDGEQDAIVHTLGVSRLRGPSNLRCIGRRPTGQG